VIKKHLQNFKKELIPTALLLLAVFAFRSTFAEPYAVPTGSMEPTILPGDRLFVSKMAYSLKLPFIGISVLETGKPQRGDIIVFKYPRDPSIDYVKRLIGLPGDQIEVNDGKITLNGNPLPLSEPVNSSDDRTMTYRESLDQVVHFVQRLPHVPMSQTQKIIVPEKHYFFMGDNRDNSNDGRYWGFVPEEYLKGKALRIWFSLNSQNSGLPTVRWERIGNKL